MEPVLDGIDLIDALLTRKSVPAPALVAPGPSEEELERILAAGHRAADHGRLRPWRFHLVRGEFREPFVELWLAALQRMAPDTAPEKIAAKRKAYAQPPLVIVAGTKITASEKVPDSEQIVATGCAVQNILNAAHTLGYGAILLSGKAVLDEVLKSSFGLGPEDYLLGAIYLGTPKVRPAAPPADTDGRVFEWRGGEPG